MGDRVEAGVELLERTHLDELSVAQALDMIEAVSSTPSIQREILDVAEDRGIIEREDGTIEAVGELDRIQFATDVVTKEGNFNCRRCGANLGTGHFVVLDSSDVGPFGSTCIRKTLGLE